MHVHIKDRKTVSDDHALLQKVKYELEKNNGEKIGQEREVYDHGNAVAVLLFNKEEKKILLTRQFRLPTFLNGNPTGLLLEACAGIVEEGEDPAETMKREILEETGYEVEEVKKVYEAYSSAGVLTELLYLYLAPYNASMKKEKGGGLKEEGEDIMLVELPLDRATQMLENGEIRDAKTIILLQYLLMQKIM
jgi:GDP-mannose pyrophosphatase NudK